MKGIPVISDGVKKNAGHQIYFMFYFKENHKEDKRWPCVQCSKTPGMVDDSNRFIVLSTVAFRHEKRVSIAHLKAYFLIAKAESMSVATIETSPLGAFNPET